MSVTDFHLMVSKNQGSIGSDTGQWTLQWDDRVAAQVDVTIDDALSSDGKRLRIDWNGETCHRSTPHRTVEMAKDEAKGELKHIFSKKASIPDADITFENPDRHQTGE